MPPFRLVYACLLYAALSCGGRASAQAGTAASASAAGAGADTSTLVARVAARAARGNRQALRDLVTLVGEGRRTRGTRDAAREALRNITLFDGELDVATASRQDLLDFYYAHRGEIRHSGLLDAFYVTPIEQQGTRYELIGLDVYQQSDRSMHLRKYIAYVEEAIRYESVADLRDLIEKIADLHLLEGQAYLLGLLEGPGGDLLAADASAFFHYLDQIMQRPSPEVAEALFRSERAGYLRGGSLARYMSRLCNVGFSASWSAERQQDRYSRLLDSLGGLRRVREYGYREMLNFKPAHFREAVDYYGRVLADDDAPVYLQHNALLDLVATNHPRSLFYLSSQLMRARLGRRTTYPAVHYLYALRKLTNLGVLVPDADDQMVYQLDVTGDRTAWLNYVRYYAAHYDDYDYDEHRGSFVNRHDQTLETENLERLFRLLNSESDVVALDAYARLTQADPLEISALVNKYKDLLRTTNHRVPALRDGHLEHTSQFTAYCERNRVQYMPDGELRRQLDSLLHPLDPRVRVALENDLIASATLPQLTRIEYWASIHQYDLKAGYSVGRILDYGYSRHWPALLASDTELRLYLKKATLFSRMEGIGVSDSYLRKFVGLDSAAVDRLGNLLRSETDRHVSRALRRLLDSDETSAGHLAEVDQFLEEPTQFSREEIAALVRPTLEQLSELLWRMADGAAPKAKFLYRAYLQHQVAIEAVPDLMSLLMRDESPDVVAGLLSDVYHFEWDEADGTAAEQWLGYWRLHSHSYADWGEAFYGLQLAKVEEADRVTGGDLNAILVSPYYTDADRDAVLDALPRLVSNRHLFVLRFSPALTWDEREVLDGLNLTYKDVQDLDKLFPEASPGELVRYVMDAAAAFDEEDRGKLVNGLMRKPWIEEVLDDSTAVDVAAQFEAALTFYLEESEFLSEYEEQNTALNLARLQFIGKSAGERLRISIDLDMDDAAKLRIQESILARIHYADLPEALALWPRLVEVNGKRPYNFASRDFGLPIFDLDAHYVADTFALRFARLTERELYAQYLADFGLELTRADGGLDYAEIYRILRYDIVLPFLGGGGNRRDLYTYGVIRLLELHEGTRLGFHEKLNENQLFYSFSASKRAEAWATYLLERGLASPSEADAMPSFTHTVSK